MNRSLVIVTASVVVAVIAGVGGWLYTLYSDKETTGAKDSRGFETVGEQKSEYKVLYDNSYALLIGMSDYTAGWDDLKSIPTELETVKKALKEQGFQVEEHLNLKKDDLDKTVWNFITKRGLDPNNRLLFYYSGHGHSRNNGEKGYIVPVDAPNPDQDEAGFVAKAVSMDQIVTWAKEIESKHALFVFDSCFSGQVLKVRSSNSRPKVIDTLTDKPARQFITAGSADEAVPAQSVFTPAFVDGIEHGLADLDNDGYVTGLELGLYLRNKVPEYSEQTPQYGAIKEYELSQGDFVFTLAGTQVATKQPAPETEVVEPPAPQPPRAPPPPPNEDVGYLQVVTNIDGQIYINELLIGNVGPDKVLNYTDLKPGDVKLKVTAKGYKTLEKTVAIKVGEWTQESLVLVPNIPMVKLTVHSNISENLVYLDNQLKGSTPLALEMPPGRYEVRIEKDGYVPFKEIADLSNGKNKTIEASLSVKSVAVAAAPKIKVRVNRDHFTEGESIILRWISQNAKEVTLDGAPVSVKGSKTVVADKTRTFIFEAINSDGKKTQEKIDVVVNTPIPMPKIVRFTSDKKRYKHGEKIQLTWTTSNVKDVTLNGKRVPKHYTQSFEAKKSSYTFTLTAINSEGKKVSQVLTVKVASLTNPLVPPKPPIIKLDPSKLNIIREMDKK